MESFFTAKGKSFLILMRSGERLKQTLIVWPAPTRASPTCPSTWECILLMVFFIFQSKTHLDWIVELQKERKEKRRKREGTPKPWQQQQQMQVLLNEGLISCCRADYEHVVEFAGPEPVLWHTTTQQGRRIRTYTPDDESANIRINTNPL